MTTIARQPKSPARRGLRRSERTDRGPGRKVLRWLAPLAFLVIILVLWQLGVRKVGIPAYLVPTPSATATDLYQGFVHGSYITQTWTTLEEVLLGVAIGAAVGAVGGMLMAWSQTLDVIVGPYAVALNALPKVAVAPFLVIWLGQGLTSKIVITALIAFFPLLVNMSGGLKAVPADQLELMRSLRASRWQIFLKIQLPNSLPRAFDGLAIAVTLGPIGAIVSEFVGSSRGIGFYITEATQLAQSAAMFSMFVILIAMSLALYAIVRLVGRKIVFWQHTTASGI